MPRIENIVDHYSPYLGYVWLVDLNNAKIVCHATDNPNDTTIRCHVASSVDTNPELKIYRDLDELLSSLPRVIPAIHIFTKNMIIVKSFYHVKNPR